MEKWISDIYVAAKLKHKELGLKDGMAIFYSPVKYTPKILFIGDNPGGEKGEIHNYPPHDNFYLKENYQLALAIRNKIFYKENLKKWLTNSVIINRIFFQSKNLKKLGTQVNIKDIEQWCLPHLKTIINKINPDIIFAESIGTYERLIYDLGGKFGEVLIPDSGRGLMKSGNIGDKLIIGIKHPTGSRPRISDAKFKLISSKLEELLAK